MSTPIRVDFHCHSSLSDGALAPEALADLLANAGMAHAALADHDTLDGLDPFRKRLASRGVGFLTGVEITVQWRGREAHLLAYGIDPDHAELRATLAAIRQSREPGVDSIAGSVRKNRLSLTRASAPTAINRMALTFSVIDDKAAMQRFRTKTYQALAEADKAGRVPEQYAYLVQAVPAWIEQKTDMIFRGAPHLLVVAATPESVCPAEDVNLALAYFELLAQSAQLGTV